jgi:hypothetical protein
MRGFSFFRVVLHMPNFDANEWYIDRRARCVDAPAHVNSLLARHAGMTPRHDRPPGSPS